MKVVNIVEWSNSKVIEELESLLALAKTGEMRGLAVCVVRKDGRSIGCGWSRESDVPIAVLHYGVSTLQAGLLGLSMEDPE